MNQKPLKIEEIFLNWLDFQRKYNKSLKELFEKTINYLSPQIQNEIIDIVASEIIKKILMRSRYVE